MEVKGEEGIQGNILVCCFGNSGDCGQIILPVNVKGEKENLHSKSPQVFLRLRYL